MSNNLDLLGAVKISEHLESNPPVKILELDDNGFNDDDTILLCLSWALRKQIISHLFLVSKFPVWSECHIRVQSHM